LTGKPFFNLGKSKKGSDRMNILAVGAHPDDIEFGCGGTLLKYAEKGHGVNLLILTSGGVGGEPDIRRTEQEESAKFMNADQVFWGDFRDTELPLTKDTIRVIEEVIEQIKPSVVLFNDGEDTHQDHRVVTKACISATRYIKEVLCFEVPSSRNFQPNIFVDIGDVVDKKMELLSKHASQVERTQVENLTILESAKSCAVFRGYQGRVKYAEGFRAMRILMGIE